MIQCRIISERIEISFLVIWKENYRQKQGQICDILCLLYVIAHGDRNNIKFHTPSMKIGLYLKQNFDILRRKRIHFVK